MKKAARLIGSLAFACAIAAGSDVARALSPAEDVATDGAGDGAAESLVESGIELRRNGRDEEALAVFARALEQSPRSTRIKVHLAATYQALGQWVEAERYLREAASNPDDAYIRRHRATIEKAYAFIEQRLGSLDVVGGPDGAELVLSGRPVGQLPLSQPVRVPVGSYLLEVRKPGYYTVSRPISIGSGAMLRESVVLGEREQSELGASSAAERAPIEAESRSGSPRWLTWTLGGAGVGYWEPINRVYGLDIAIVNDVVDPTFSFMTVDHDGKIRMDCSSAYAMARLVEQKDRRVAQYGARDGDALALAARQRHAALADLGLVALVQLEDELVAVAGGAGDRLRKPGVEFAAAGGGDAVDGAVRARARGDDP